MAAVTNETEDVHCSMCLEQFNISRQLSSAHSVCVKCLESFITTEANNSTKLCSETFSGYIHSACPSIKDRGTCELASSCPTSPILQSVLTESKVGRLCDACNTDGEAVPAVGFCVLCKEAMCGKCQQFHRRQKISKDHVFISVDGLECNPEHGLKLIEGFTCSEHHGEDIKYYCTDHKVSCCGTCFFEGHKRCTKVIDLRKELPYRLHNKLDITITDMKTIEIHLKTFMEMNEAFVNNLKCQFDRLTNIIGEIRTKFNAALDQLEKIVVTEGNGICKLEVIRIQDENHQCLSLLHAVRNSHAIIEAVSKYGSSLQKIIMFEKMRLQLQSYCSLIGEKYMNTGTVTLELEFASQMQSILSVSLFDFGKVVTTTSYKTLNLTTLHRPAKDCHVEKVGVINLKFHTGRSPWYSGVTFLSRDRVMLADHWNKQCILLSSSYQFITCLALRGNPLNVCALDDQEVAVSFYNENKILILSVAGNKIRPVRKIATKYNCNGIAAVRKGEMVMNGYCGDRTSQWSLITTRGYVKCTHQYEADAHYLNYIAVNSTKTLVFVSVCAMDSLLCFDLDGRKVFVYSSGNLLYPTGVAVDNYDNIYVVGNRSDNIHQLSPDGSFKQVIQKGVPKYPRAICIHQSKNILIITNTSYDRTKLYVCQLK